jgi:hypothetical protein
MTDRWKERLRPLDDDIPSEDVWRRAQAGPTRSDMTDEPRPNARARVTAGVTAFAVFAVAAAFAWNAFMPNDDPLERAPGGADPFAGTILWPERTGQELAVTQAAVDAVDDWGSWRLDAEQVAIRFAREVLGWPAPEGRWGVQLETLTGVQPHPLVVATLSWLPIPCPTPAPGDTIPIACPPPRLDQQLELLQPDREGPGGIWVVRSATSETLVPQPGDLAVGDTLPEDASVGAAVTVPEGWTSEPDGYRAAMGVQVGDGDGCDASARTDTALASVRSIELPAGDIGDACAPVAPAYLWVAAGLAQQMDPATGELFPVADPLDGGSEPLPLLGLTAVPFAVSVPDEGSTSPSPSDAPSPTETRSPPPADASTAQELPGVPFGVCRITSIAGDVGDGLDTAWVFEEERVPGSGCEGSEGFQHLGLGSNGQVEVMSDRLTDLLGDDSYRAWLYATADLDADGTDEIALARRGGEPTARHLWFFGYRNGQLGPLFEDCGEACREVPWNVEIGPVAHENGAVTPGGLSCAPIDPLYEGPADFDVVTWQASADDPQDVHLDLWALEQGAIHFVRDLGYIFNGEGFYPPSGLDDLCGSEVQDPPDFPGY